MEGDLGVSWMTAMACSLLTAQLWHCAARSPARPPTSASAENAESAKESRPVDGTMIDSSYCLMEKEKNNKLNLAWLGFLWRDKGRENNKPRPFLPISNEISFYSDQQEIPIKKKRKRK